MRVGRPKYLADRGTGVQEFDVVVDQRKVEFEEVRQSSVLNRIVAKSRLLLVALPRL